MKGAFDIVMRNEASRRIFEIFRGPIPPDTTINGIRTVFDPNGLRPYIANWEEMAQCMLQSLQREIAATGSDALVQLRDDLFSYPDVPSRFRRLTSSGCEPPLINLHLRKGNLALSFFSAVTFLSRARDITLQDLKIECFFPADYATEQFARNLAAARAVAV
jgi:hypothetical protein